MTDRDIHAFLKQERQRFIRYVRSRLSEALATDAEDLVHDVMVKLLEKADLIPHRDSLPAYVYRALKNRIIDHNRTRKPTLSFDDSDHQEISLAEILRDTQPASHDLLHTQRGRIALFTAFDHLSAIERDVVIAHEFEGEPFHELSRRWGIPRNTLLSHKHRALRKLKKRLSNFR